MKITSLRAEKILNSAGHWTIGCLLETEGGKKVDASVPSGISTGTHEKATVSPDQAIVQIEKEVLPAIINQELNQEQLDQILTGNRWGSNATLAVSAAFFKLEEVKIEKLPEIMMLIFEGKKHGNPKLKTQEFMIIIDHLVEGVGFYQKVIGYLAEEGMMTTVGAEGGLSPFELDDEKILSLMQKLAAERIALDLAGNTNTLSMDSLLDIVRRYPIVSLEDPFPEDQPNMWQEFLPKVMEINPNLLVIADDLTVTNSEKIKKGFEEKLFNAVIIKPNQQGTITDARKALETAKSLGIKTIVSHRGEETNDYWIVDFALNFGADFVKLGGPCRGERIAKYNRLLALTAH